MHPCCHGMLGRQIGIGTAWGVGRVWMVKYTLLLLPKPYKQTILSMHVLAKHISDASALCQRTILGIRFEY